MEIRPSAPVINPRDARLGRPGQCGFGLVMERKREDFYPQVKRWTYAGKPTRKARRYAALERRAMRWRRDWLRAQPEA